MLEHTPQTVVVAKHPPLSEAAPESKRFTIGQLTDHLCHYIADDQPPYTYCAHEAVPGKRWCKFHYELCVQRVSHSEAMRRADRATRSASAVGHGKTFVE